MLTTDVMLKGGTTPAYSPPPAPGPTVSSVDPNVHIAPQIAAPNEPLPPDIAISADVLKVVETHPFFANAPAVRVSACSTASSMTSITSGGGGTTTGTYATDEIVPWLRQGLVKTTSTMQAHTATSAGSMQSTTQNTSISVANGLFGLGWKGVTRSKFGTTTTTSKVVRLENMSGAIFPIQDGPRRAVFTQA